MYGHVAAPEIQAKRSGCPAKAIPERLPCLPQPLASGPRAGTAQAPRAAGSDPGRNPWLLPTAPIRARVGRNLSGPGRRRGQGAARPTRLERRPGHGEEEGEPRGRE